MKGVTVNTGRLSIFQRVVERGSFSRAARELHLTQPSISAAVDQLEREWGARLLERRGRRGIRPTEAGRVLYERSKEILQLVDRTRLELEEVNRGDRAEIRIAICLG